MSVLVDTNVLLRSAPHSDPSYQAVLHDVNQRLARGERLCIVPQNLVEFWAVATRPREQNGIGLEPAEARTELARLKSLFTFLPDTSEIHEKWEQLIEQYDVRGKKVHDARLVAAMHVHSLTHLLTLNASDFTRYRDIHLLIPSV